MDNSSFLKDDLSIGGSNRWNILKKVKNVTTFLTIWTSLTFFKKEVMLVNNFFESR